MSVTSNNPENYLRWISPKAGDPTYSILKAHLLFEELLRAYLSKTLPHPEALEGSRLSFSQLLAVVRAVSGNVPVDCWIWQAIADLNRIRNLLAHETAPGKLSSRIQSYVELVQASTVPLLSPQSSTGEHASVREHIYAVDMVTMALYYVAADRLGFNVDTVLGIEAAHSQELRNRDAI